MSNKKPEKTPVSYDSASEGGFATDVSVTWVQIQCDD